MPETAQKATVTHELTKEMAHLLTECLIISADNPFTATMFFGGDEARMKAEMKQWTRELLDAIEPLGW